jgi:hypothetical protein
VIWNILLWAWLIVPFVLATIAAVRWKGKYRGYWYTRKGAFFGRLGSSIGFGFIVVVIGGIVLGLLATFTGTDESRSWETKLRALNTGSEVHGQFFLGSGRIDEDPVFSFLYEQADGGVKLSSVPADRSTVYEHETNNDRPFLTTTETHRAANQFWAPFTLSPRVSGYQYDFHIPEGSVLNSYEVTP